MLEKISGIILDITPHSDRHNVVTVFTRSRGRMAFLSSAGGGKTGRMRNSRLQPLAVIDADINFKQNAELQKLGSFSLRHVWAGIYFHPLKAMVGLFLSEFLNRLLRASMSDEALFDYIERSLQFFDSLEENISDFHLTFMASLLPFMGIQPDISEWHDGVFFDFRSGNFSEMRPSHSDYLDNADSEWIVHLCNMNFDNMKDFGLTTELRRKLLNILLHYYSIHYLGADNIKSLKIIQETLYA
ncbi:MAG: DNA repair protein RecO [Muribaculaceae bacterium]|nr:DNA repair protein RecO [Muribaculaceae bacterium]